MQDLLSFSDNFSCRCHNFIQPFCGFSSFNFVQYVIVLSCDTNEYNLSFSFLGLQLTLNFLNQTKLKDGGEETEREDSLLVLSPYYPLIDCQWWNGVQPQVCEDSTLTSCGGALNR